MSIGLLCDDVAAIAKVAAASLDDVASQAGKADVKAADVRDRRRRRDTGYVVGFSAKRDCRSSPGIAMGSLRNKL